MKTFSPFSSTRARAHPSTLAVKELPLEPCTVTRREGSRKSAAAASNATLDAPFVEQPCHGVKSSTRGGRDTLNNERNLLLFSFYFSTIRSNARAHAVWPREGEDREARGGEGRGGSKGVTF